MVHFINLILRDDFRGFVNRRMASSVNGYSFPSAFPKLYRYRSLSDYSINDIISGTISLTSIGEFNDLFDGAIHQYGTKEKIEEAAEADWNELEELRKTAQLPNGFFQRDYHIEQSKKLYKRESRFKFRELAYLGTYICCFSTCNSSTLMWAHYADSNRGICLEYDFNRLPDDNVFRYFVFPVAYTPSPINVSDLLADKDCSIYEYPVDAAVLCSALNKSTIWNYEKEWRAVMVLEGFTDRWFPIKKNIFPSKVILGYHFMKSFFYHDSKDRSEWDKCHHSIEKFMELLSFLEQKSIAVDFMTPSIGEYKLVPKSIPVNSLKSFILNYFKKNRPEPIRFYYTIHDQLMDLALDGTPKTFLHI